MTGRPNSSWSSACAARSVRKPVPARTRFADDEQVALALVGLAGGVRDVAAVGEPLLVRGTLGLALGVAELGGVHDAVQDGRAVGGVDHVRQAGDRVDRLDGVAEVQVHVAQRAPLADGQVGVGVPGLVHPRVDLVGHRVVDGLAHQVAAIGTSGGGGGHEGSSWRVVADKATSRYGPDRASQVARWGAIRCVSYALSRRSVARASRRAFISAYRTIAAEERLEQRLGESAGERAGQVDVLAPEHPAGRRSGGHDDDARVPLEHVPDLGERRDPRLRADRRVVAVDGHHVGQAGEAAARERARDRGDRRARAPAGPSSDTRVSGIQRSWLRRSATSAHAVVASTGKDRTTASIGMLVTRPSSARVACLSMESRRWGVQVGRSGSSGWGAGSSARTGGRCPTRRRWRCWVPPSTRA